MHRLRETFLGSSSFRVIKGASIRCIRYCKIFELNNVGTLDPGFAFQNRAMLAVDTGPRNYNPRGELFPNFVISIKRRNK